MALDPSLQVDRDNGNINNPRLMLQETCKSDNLRSKVIEYCLSDYEHFAEDMNGGMLVSDMPPRYNFRTLHDRLAAMSEPTCMVGHFEVARTAEVINRTIKVLH